MNSSCSRRIYISGPLQSAADLEAARAVYEAAAAACSAAGWMPYIPHQATDPVRHREIASTDVFVRDIQGVEEADAVLAFIGTASSGVGAELGIAYLRRKPVIAVYFKSEAPSRFLIGMLETAGSDVISAESWADAAPLVRHALDQASRRLDCTNAAR